MIEEKVFNPKLAPDHQIILDATSDLICAFDKDYQLAYFNQSFKKNFELFVKETLEETKPLNDYSGLSRFIDLQSNWEVWLERAFSGEKFKESIEYQIIGKKLFYTLEFIPVIKNNEVGYIQIAAREDTFRRNYEDLLKKNKEIVIALSGSFDVIIKDGKTRKKFSSWDSFQKLKVILIYLRLCLRSLRNIVTSNSLLPE